jgi:hypothetical protein
MQELGGNGSSGVTGKTPQSSYDRLAATGAECVKMDFWDGTGQCWYTDRDWQFKPAVWPDGFDFAKKARKAGLKASLYMGSTYLDGDLNTTEARDRQLAALLKRYDEGWFDMWRTDRYTAPHDPMPSTYQGILNFQYIIDHLIANRPGFRYENCANGGKFKGFNICRRMTFMTMNDKDQTPWLTRSTYYSDTFAINPVQLKSDLGPATHPYYLRTDMLGANISRSTRPGSVRSCAAPTSITSCPCPTARTGTASSSTTPTSTAAPSSCSSRQTQCPSPSTSNCAACSATRFTGSSSRMPRNAPAR